MFRTKQNINSNEQTIRKKLSIVTSNESSTDEGSNQKANIYQLRQKTSPNVVVINNKMISTKISNGNQGNINIDHQKDVLIKEIIGNDDIIQENNNDKFRSLFDLNDNKLDTELKFDINNKYIIPNNSSSLMSKNSLKKNYFNKKDKSLDEYFRNNIIKRYKRKNSFNINKLKTSSNNYDNFKFNSNTPKSDMKNKNKTRILSINKKELKYNDSVFTYNQSKNKCDKNNSISRFIFKNNSGVGKQDIKELKEKKIEKIIHYMNNNKNPSLNVNLLHNNKNDGISILSNISNRNKKIITLQNNINFNDLINSSYKKSKKKLFLRINPYKKEKTDYYDNNEEEDIKDYNNDKININQMKIKSIINENKMRCLTKDNYYRKNHHFLNDLNISTDYTSREKKKDPQSACKKKMKHISLDSSSNIISNNNRKTRNNSQIRNKFYKKEKINNKNYKHLLNDVQKRMSFLINDLINYIELLKKEKKEK
jgi:hypothetical protein